MGAGNSAAWWNMKVFTMDENINIFNYAEVLLFFTTEQKRCLDRESYPGTLQGQFFNIKLSRSTTSQHLLTQETC